MNRMTMITAILAVVIISARGQGFINLNFESAYNLPGDPPIPDGVNVATTNALPGWTVSDGDMVLSEISYVSNFFSGFSTSVELEGGSLALDGNFSAGLFPDGSISQTAMVPGGAESLQFEANTIVNLSVTLGGQSLSYSAISEGPDYYVYGADIPTALDGKVETLTFGVNGPVDLRLDGIVFSPTGVPEPSECALIGLGTMLFGLLRRGRVPITR